MRQQQQLSIKLYSCDYCRKKSQYAWNIKRHQDTHHRGKEYCITTIEQNVNEGESQVRDTKVDISSIDTVDDVMIRAYDWLRADITFESSEKIFESLFDNILFGREEFKSILYNKKKKSYLIIEECDALEADVDCVLGTIEAMLWKTCSAYLDLVEMGNYDFIKKNTRDFIERIMLGEEKINEWIEQNQEVILKKIRDLNNVSF